MIQHDDLHGANVYLREDTTRILDGGDSRVSHPFLTLIVTFLHLDEMSELPRDTFELAQRLGAFAHLSRSCVCWMRFPKSSDPGSRRTCRRSSRAASRTVH